MSLKELVVISGKGGTGKTSVTASLAALCQNAAIADCDVDAADLHLVLSPQVDHCEEFIGGGKAAISPDRCTSCGLCRKVCRFEAITRDADGRYRIDRLSCEGCGACLLACKVDAIKLAPTVAGKWFTSKTRLGPMSHAELGIAADNSGKLVSVVRSNARKIAEQNNLPLVIIDGPPGIGCPVIASVTGANLALIVTEPTLSGLHDLQRIAELTAHFKIKTMVCINKWDINPELTERIEKTAGEFGIAVAGRLRYDPAATKAQIAGKTIVEFTADGIAGDIKVLWGIVSNALEMEIK